MSIAVLTQVYDEVRRLAIAGSVVAPGDFRLKKLVPPLEKAGEKTPVFAKVAGSAAKLVDSNEKGSAEALLELSTLINAVLYTQGETGASGELTPIETTSVSGHHTRTTARMLKPLMEALTTTGSGRLEIIKDAFERGAFSDLRLVKPAITAIDDPYPDIGDFIAEKVLPLYGKAILPDLRTKFDIKGKAGHPRRLALMHRIDPEGTGPLVKEALDNGSKEVKVVAIECLGTWPERLLSFLRPLSYLLEQAAAKAKDVRQAALKALAKSDESEAIAALETALKGGDIEIAVAPVRESTNPKLLQAVLMESDAQLAQLLAGKEKDKKVVGKQVERMLALLECLRGKSNKAVEAYLLKCFAVRERLTMIKAEPAGKDIQQRLVSIMAEGPTKTQAAVVDAHASLDADELAQAFIAACRSRKAPEVFSTFSSYLTAKVDVKNKRRDPAQAKYEAIAEVLLVRWRHRDDGDDLIGKIDPRWLDVAVTQCRQKNTFTLAQPGLTPGPLELVLSLARPGHADANKLLADAFDDRLKKSKDLWDCVQVLEAMVRVQHPAVTDATIAIIEKHAKGSQNYGLYLIGQLIPQLPKEAIPRLEALLPTLPEKVIDQLLEYVTELKNRT